MLPCALDLDQESLEAGMKVHILVTASDRARRLNGHYQGESSAPRLVELRNFSSRIPEQVSFAKAQQMRQKKAPPFIKVESK
jgi:hypothetical protein